MLNRPRADDPRDGDWWHAGWPAQVAAWVDASLAPLGRRRTGAGVSHKRWPLSAVLSFPTADGQPVVVKASAPHFGREAAITAAVAAIAPSLAPDVLAVEPDRGWLLMGPLPGREDDPPDDVLRTVAAGLALAQLAALNAQDALLAAGCPDRSSERTWAQFRAIVETARDTAGLDEAAYAELVRALPRIERGFAEFAGAGLPQTLVHGDLHPGNIAWAEPSSAEAGRPVVFDWSDTALAQPFLDVAHLSRHGLGGTGPPPWLEAYLEPWRAAYPSADLATALDRSVLADRVYQVCTYEGLRLGLGPRGVAEFTGISARLLAQLSTGSPSGQPPSG